MPAVSQQQRGLIFGKRSQYGSKENTPKKWKWVWEEGWENKGKLPKKKKKKNKKNESVVYFTDMVNEAADNEDKNLKKLVKYFYEVCGFCDELNIYEWDEADKSMQEMKAWVKKNYGHLK